MANTRFMIGRNSCFAQPRNSSSVRPCLRKPHWNWYRLRSFRNGSTALAVLSSLRAPQNGGCTTGTSCVIARRRFCTAADVDGAERALIRLAQRPCRVPRLAAALGLDRRQIVVEAVARHPVHQVQPVERIPRIGHPAARIGAHAIILDIVAGQRGPPQHDGDIQPLPCHLLEVLAHHHGGFHQQPGHADRVRRCSFAAATMSARGTLMPRLITR